MPEDLQLLQETKQLNDRIITAAGRILKSQFPEIKLFQPTLYAQTLQKLHPAEEGSLFFSRFSQGQVCHYDSLQARYLALELRKQLITLYAHTSDGSTKLQIIQPQVQVQKGSKDCGCFAVAFAVSLLLGDDPATLTYQQKDMRRHFIKCLDSELFTPFPATEKAKRNLPPLKLNIRL